MSSSSAYKPAPFFNTLLADNLQQVASVSLSLHWAEGHHSAPDTSLLIIADEAKSIPEPIFEAVDRCSFNTLLLISSPG